MLQPLSSPSSSLYCAEDADEVANWDADEEQILIDPTSFHDPHRPISHLLSSEFDHCPLPDYLPRLRSRSVDSTARQDAVNWILKVHGFYHFRPVTACLAVNYLDRFLSCNDLPEGSGGWPWQLLSVTCLSVAAKMEETHVPLLLDLQVMEPRFVFEPNTVRRMELLLMSALRWRMRAVTPFDFLDHFASLLLADNLSASRWAALLSRAADLVLCTHRVVGFLKYRPSAISAAAVLCATGEIGIFSAADEFDFSCFYETVNKEMVEGCLGLMEEYLIETCSSARPLKSEPAGSEPPMPQSPVGVLDAAACGSCDSQKSTSAPELSGPNNEPVNAEPTSPPSKRRRVGAMSCTESIDKVDVE